MNDTNYILTNEDVDWLEQIELARASASQSAQVDPQRVTVNPLLIPSLLTRARLSEATRRAEERRLAAMERKRLALRCRKKRDGRKVQWQRKQYNKRQKNKKQFIRDAGLGAILNTRCCKRIDQALWKKYISPLFEEYSPEYLSIKLYKRVPVGVAGRYGRYYGTKEFPHTVYTLKVVHSLLGVVYEGKEQYERDIQNKEQLGN